MVHEGLHAYRLQDNPMERLYHDAWKAENIEGHVLEYILGDDNNRVPPPSARDEKVAATVIQWLGSPVGQCFIERVQAGKVGVDLNTFVQREELRILAFKRWWREQHGLNPDQFPMTMPPENAGVWHEMLDTFKEDH